jgi:MoxR-like ATPase
MGSSSFFAVFCATLAQKFIKVGTVARAIALALVSGRNLLLWGPGGHGKSEITQAALRLVYAREEIFVQTCGEGLTEDKLWGGIDLAILDKESLVRYRTSESFLNYSVAVFEEIFDAPPVVLLSLKDTIQARELRNGAQRVPMTTEVIIGLTNKEPREIAELGPSAQALIERFPLHLRVAWEKYTANDYVGLFHKLSEKNTNPPEDGALSAQLRAVKEIFNKSTDLNGHSLAVAELLAKAGENSTPISPRTAAHATAIVRAAAALRGTTCVERDDMMSLQFLPGMERLTEELQKDIATALAKVKSATELSNIQEEMSKLTACLESEATPIKCLQVYKKIQNVSDKLATLPVVDEHVERRNSIRESISGLLSRAIKKALDNTRV